MNLPSLIFIDGGDPTETQKADELLKAHGFAGVQGQTTNPTLVAKNPDVQKYIAAGKKLTQAEALSQYKKIVTSVAGVTSGPISIQVIGDQSTSKDDMLAQARVYKDWIPNGVVKFPCTTNGLAAAEIFCQEFPVNITLNFSQAQAAAVYQVTKLTKHRVFISPFVGRLDDLGENGMDVVANIVRMYNNSPQPSLNLREGVPPLNLRGGQKGLLHSKVHSCHVEVLTASVRTLNHLLYALFLKSPAITVPYKILLEWESLGFRLPGEDFIYDYGALKPIPYQELTLDRDWCSYDLRHDLTDKGLAKFMEDWRSIIK